MERSCCPFCLCTSLVKKGKDGQGRQRYYCKGCETFFTDRRGEELDESELLLLKSKLSFELKFSWNGEYPDLDSRVEKRLFSKLPEIPCGDEDTMFEADLIRHLAKEISLPEKEVENALYRAIARYIASL